ncbi:hypothetical protein OSB04_032184 [Centaurea solstitialis]|uniref:ARID domain-containing protein n=1 Tax=Centaurea solstitialis TaxID=347529 RepID=A0AA38W8V2_9ASTR|nr:hypothetical protein OSB04_032184 [Centaurea solstitialis]
MTQFLEGPAREIKWGSTKLEDKGFSYKHDMKKILDDCIKCAKRSGNIGSFQSQQLVSERHDDTEGLNQDKEKAIRAMMRYYDTLYFKDCSIVTEGKSSNTPSKDEFESMIGFLIMVNEQEIDEGCKGLVADHFEKMVKWFYRDFMYCEERPTPVRINNTDVCLLDLYVTVKGMKGHTRVSTKNEWPQVASAMGFPKNCADDFMECYSTHLSLLEAYYNVARNYSSEELVPELAEYGTKSRLTEGETAQELVGSNGRRMDGEEDDDMHGIIEYDDGDTLVISFEGPQASSDGEEDAVPDSDDGKTILMID